MNARNYVKRIFNRRLGPVLAAAQKRFAARIDVFVARWLAHCAAKIEAAQGLFELDRKPARGFGAVMGLASSPHWDESA